MISSSFSTAYTTPTTFNKSMEEEKGETASSTQTRRLVEVSSAGSINDSADGGWQLREEQSYTQDKAMSQAAATTSSSRLLSCDFPSLFAQKEHSILSSASMAGHYHHDLSKMSKEQLEPSIRPILKGLQQIDAETLLKLSRSTSRDFHHPTIGNGIRVHPIHAYVQPHNHSQNTVRYLHLTHIHDHYSMGIFIFPPHSKIPLHDHPGMVVASRILYGRLYRQQLDWVDDCPSPSRKKQWLYPERPPSLRARRHAVEELEAPAVTVLYPREGNLHEFVAGPEGAAVLDVLLPPYQDHERDCTYYDIIMNPNDSGGGDTDPAPQLCSLNIIPEPGEICISGYYCDLGEEPR